MQCAHVGIHRHKAETYANLQMRNYHFDKLTPMQKLDMPWMLSAV